MAWEIHESVQRGRKSYKVLKGRKEVGLAEAQASYYINLAEEDKIQRLGWVLITQGLEFQHEECLLNSTGNGVLQTFKQGSNTIKAVIQED